MVKGQYFTLPLSGDDVNAVIVSGATLLQPTQYPWPQASATRPTSETR